MSAIVSGWSLHQTLFHQTEFSCDFSGYQVPHHQAANQFPVWYLFMRFTHNFLKTYKLDILSSRFLLSSSSRESQVKTKPSRHLPLTANILISIFVVPTVNHFKSGPPLVVQSKNNPLFASSSVQLLSSKGAEKSSRRFQDFVPSYSDIKRPSHIQPSKGGPPQTACVQRVGESV